MAYSFPLFGPTLKTRPAGEQYPTNLSAMNRYTWDTTFLDLYDRCLEKYRGGDSDYNGWFEEGDAAFLKKIGYTPVEFFDFVEDFAVGGEPSPSTAVMIAAVRRDYLDVVMDGKLSDETISPSRLPAKTEALAGFTWLPRIIAKAEAKLRGEMDPDTMFCCGGDRAFLREHDIAPADFLRVVWAAKGDKDKVVAYVRQRSSAGA